MRQARHITVAVSPELYRQTRRIAADYDTTVTATVTAIVADLLRKLPRLVKHTPYASASAPTPNPSTTPQTSATRDEAQKSAATPYPSKTSGASPAPHTAPVRQYDPPTSTS